MEQNEYQVISIILVIRAANQPHMHIGCLLSETLTSCHGYQYNKEGEMQAIAHHSISPCCYFSGLRALMTTGVILKENNLAHPPLPPTLQKTFPSLAVCSGSPMTYRKK